MTVIKEARICIASVVVFSSLTIWTMFFVAAKAEKVSATMEIGVNNLTEINLTASNESSITLKDCLISKGLIVKK